ncbi:hypothetical protein NMY22_g2256 [Coprinellus aureogranulatus]|nr:hypothetical protein NMY22_g2256 [Coprinellus aureogranulatus]
MSRVARAKSWEIWKNGEWEKTLDRCEEDLEWAQSKFNVNLVASMMSSRCSHTADRTQLTMVTSQRDLNVKADKTLDAVGQLRELISTFVNTRQTSLPSELEISLGMVENNGSNDFEQLMEAGQQGLRCVMKQSIGSSPMIADKLVDSPGPSSPIPSRGGSADTHEVEKWQTTLYNFHVQTGVLPTCKVINGEVTRTSDMAVDGGVYSDIWQGLYLNHGKVALKALRNTKADDPRSQERFRREVELWSRLKHDHILQFYGIVTNIGKHIHMVSPWQENGNILKYVESHPYINRLWLMGGAASGLEYLHANKIVHGNMKCRTVQYSGHGKGEASAFMFRQWFWAQDSPQHPGTLGRSMHIRLWDVQIGGRSHVDERFGHPNSTRRERQMAGS